MAKKQTKKNEPLSFKVLEAPAGNPPPQTIATTATYQAPVKKVVNISYVGTGADDLIYYVSPGKRFYVMGITLTSTLVTGANVTLYKDTAAFPNYFVCHMDVTPTNPAVHFGGGKEPVHVFEPGSFVFITAVATAYVSIYGFELDQNIPY